MFERLTSELLELAASVQGRGAQAYALVLDCCSCSCCGCIADCG